MPGQPHVARMLWLEALGFLTIIGLSWVHELGGARLWRESIFESVVAILVAVPVLLTTFHLVSRLYALEQFLRVCSWCRKIHCEGNWYTLEDYFQQGFERETSHGICPGCADKIERQVDEAILAANVSSPAAVA